VSAVVKGERGWGELPIRLNLPEANCDTTPRKRFGMSSGSFYVRPFEFLAFLNAVFHEPSFDQIREMLPSRLLAAEGSVHPDVDGYREVGLTKLKPWWSKAWSVLWGPPVTGKTYTTGHQVANILADETERVLVVSTTNRATDATAIARLFRFSRGSRNKLAGGQNRWTPA
jgi:hypothetical protein